MAHPEQLRALILEILGPKFAAFNIDRGAVADEFHFLESGILDSFGVVELVAQIQERESLEIDFSEFEPEQFLTLGGLVNALASSGAAAASRR